MSTYISASPQLPTDKFTTLSTACRCSRLSTLTCFSHFSFFILLFFNLSSCCALFFSSTVVRPSWRSLYWELSFTFYGEKMLLIFQYCMFYLSFIFHILFFRWLNIQPVSIKSIRCIRWFLLYYLVSSPQRQQQHEAWLYPDLHEFRIIIMKPVSGRRRVCVCMWALMFTHKLTKIGAKAQKKNRSNLQPWQAAAVSSKWSRFTGSEFISSLRCEEAQIANDCG